MKTSLFLLMGFRPNATMKVILSRPVQLAASQDVMLKHL
jgi:hypothetical protein